ncbi:MAG TPA: 3'-5' exonuclease [Paludibacter sp.]|nr:3'-5' exonuclease [Paludibacter sp.]
MKLFIYDKFWDAFLKINKGTQSKVTDFISKFRTDSKSAAINLELINTFRDQSLRTARIDQKYRAILKEVQAGELYLLVWIDNHDEAMDWAKNKRIDWNEQTQVYQVFSLDESIEKEAREAVESIELFMGKYSGKELIELGVPEVLVPSALKVKDLDNLEQLEGYLPEDAFENLFYLMDGANIDTLLTSVREGLNDESSIDSINNARSFIELTDDEILNEALQGPLQKWKYYLHPSQSTFVYGRFKGAIKLSGGAGTGKTVAALHRLKFLAERKTDPQPILFTTFTKELTDNLKSLAKGLNVNVSSFHIENIDSLAFRLARNYQLLPNSAKVFGLSSVVKPIEIWEDILLEELSSFDHEFLSREFEEVVLDQNIQSLDGYLKASRIGRGRPIGRKQRIEVWNLIEKFILKKQSAHLYYKEEVYNLLSNHLNGIESSQFSHVIVDELQDFSNVELKFIRSLVKEKENDLFLVGDPLQNIYKKRINFSKSGINIRGKRSNRLRINYRTTEEIKNLAISVLHGEDFDDFDGNMEEKSGYLSLFHGVKPQYRLYPSKEEELDAVLEEIESLISQGFHYNDIVIAARFRDSVNDFRNHMHQNMVPYVTKFLLNRNNEGIRLTTFHGLKGLEFKHVFLVDVNDRTLPFKHHNYHMLSEEEKKQEIKSEKSLFYVACSRAIQRLVITGIGNRSDLILIE